MPGAGDEPFELVVVEGGASDDGPDLRDGHAPEAVALAVAAGDGAQVAGGPLRPGAVGQPGQGGAHGVGGGEGGFDGHGGSLRVAAARARGGHP